MTRLDSMLDRLPPVYRIEAGSLLYDVLALVALQLESFDEDMDRVQRSHWIDDAFDRDDLAKIGALVGMAPESWEPDPLFRARIKATLAARLQGAVTQASLELVLTRLLAAAQKSLGVRHLELLPEGPGAPAIFRSGPADWRQRPRFVEFPPRRRRSPGLLAIHGLVKPLDQFIVDNQGREETSLEGVIRGVAGGRTALPLLVNLTTGSAVGWEGVVRLGDDLRMSVDAHGKLVARLNDVDVSDRLYTTGAFVPQVKFTPVVPDPSPTPIRLARGENRLWYLSLALYDLPSLDVAMLAMASPEQTQGVFSAKAPPGAMELAGGRWDDAVFYQQPAAALDLWWNEFAPAAFRFEVPSGAVRRTVEKRGDDPEGDRTRLFALMQETVEQLRAAAVDGRVAAMPFADQQRSYDRVVVPRDVQHEQGSPGDDRVGFAALFDVTAAEGSRFE